MAPPKTIQLRIFFTQIWLGLIFVQGTTRRRRTWRWTAWSFPPTPSLRPSSRKYYRCSFCFPWDASWMVSRRGRGRHYPIPHGWSVGGGGAGITLFPLRDIVCKRYHNFRWYLCYAPFRGNITGHIFFLCFPGDETSMDRGGGGGRNYPIPPWDMLGWTLW